MAYVRTVRMHARSFKTPTGNSHICKNTHTETRQSRNRSRRSHQITVDLLHAEQILRIGITEVRAVDRADAGASRLGGDVRIYGDDVGHGEEGGDACSHLGEEV